MVNDSYFTTAGTPPNIYFTGLRENTMMSERKLFTDRNLHSARQEHKQDKQKI